MTRPTTLLVTLVAGGAAAGAAWAQTPARAYVLDAGAHALVALDLASGKRTGVLPVAGAPTRLNLSDDGRYVVVLDRGPGEDKEERGYKATGRSAATIVDATRFEVVGRVDLGFGLDSVVTVRYAFDHPAHMQVRPDGRFAYALNQETKDVTVVDADSGQVVEKIGGGGREVRLLGGSTVAVVGPEIHLIDAARNVKVGQIRLPGLLGLVPAPDGAFAVAVADRTVLILDGATGKERARLTDFVKPTRVAFAPTAPPPSP